MTLCNIKVGEKFTVNGNPYLRIKVDLGSLFSSDFSEFVSALDLTTYKVVCLKSSTDVKRQYDRVAIRRRFKI